MSDNTLTKEEAIASMKEGKKVRHRFFNDHEWVKLKDGRVVSEDEISVPVGWFWEQRTGQHWQTGWNIVNER